MVIKTLSKKASNLSFRSIINYVDRQDKRTAKAQLFDPNFRVYHNLASTDKEEVIAEFENNYETYAVKRKNGVGCYHEIMSFRKEDNVTQEIIEDLAYTYIQERTPKGLCYGSLHTDRDHVHLHLVISSNHLMSKKANRLTQKAFLDVRKSIEEYQKEKYPQLTSIVYDQLGQKKELRQEQDRNTRREKYYKAKSRGSKTQKEEVALMLVSALEASKNSKQFHATIQDNGDCDLYIYRNKVTGIIYSGRKYRFNTLIKSIEQESTKTNCLQKLEQLKRRDLLQRVKEKQKLQDKDKKLGHDLDLSL